MWLYDNTYSYLQLCIDSHKDASWTSLTKFELNVCLYTSILNVNVKNVCRTQLCRHYDFVFFTGRVCFTRLKRLQYNNIYSPCLFVFQGHFPKYCLSLPKRSVLNSSYSQLIWFMNKRCLTVKSYPIKEFRTREIMTLNHKIKIHSIGLLFRAKWPNLSNTLCMYIYYVSESNQSKWTLDSGCERKFYTHKQGKKIKRNKKTLIKSEIYI